MLGLQYRNFLNRSKACRTRTFVTFVGSRNILTACVGCDARVFRGGCAPPFEIHKWSLVLDGPVNSHLRLPTAWLGKHA